MKEYKLGSSVLLEIVDIVRQGLLSQVDISQKLRDLVLVESDEKGYLSLKDE